MIPPIARRFIAGESTVSALARARELNDRGLGAICNRLGEHYDDARSADEDVADYRRLVEEFDRRGLRACVSVKPTQLGLDIDETTFEENLDRVVEAATDHDGFVWIDMEDPDTTEATIGAFEAAATANPGRVGVCLQANLNRTEADVDRLAAVPGKVRLVKGAYDPPAGEGIRGRDAVDAAFEARLEQLFETRDGPDQGIAAGTHDPQLIERALALADDHGIEVEIQMLMGVREDAQTELAREADVWQYVPYGDRWGAYFSRRLTERKENALFALRAIMGK